MAQTHKRSMRRCDLMEWRMGGDKASGTHGETSEYTYVGSRKRQNDKIAPWDVLGIYRLFRTLAGEKTSIR